MSNPSTLLSIDGIDLSEYAARDLTCTLSPIASGELARTVNGKLVDLTLPSHRKYAVTIECTDLEAPELTGIWRGQVVTVTLIPDIGVVDDTDGADTDDVLTLTMMVDSWQSGRREWEAKTAWSITLIEI